MLETTGRLVTKTGSLAVSGVLGVVLVNAAKKAQERGAGRRAAVEGTKAAIRGSRLLEQKVERARLEAGDILAQAKDEMGEQAQPPRSDSAGNGHEH